MKYLGEAIFYKILTNKNIYLKTNINFEGEEFELFEKGVGKIETYSGMTDVALKEEVNYYEYISKSDSKKVLSVEKWKDETEISIGKIIDPKKIKIIK